MQGRYLRAYTRPSPGANLFSLCLCQRLILCYCILLLVANIHNHRVAKHFIVLSVESHSYSDSISLLQSPEPRLLHPNHPPAHSELSRRIRHPNKAASPKHLYSPFHWRTMLLPSALPCDSHSQPTNSYCPPSRLLSPPPSNPTTPMTSNILTTCRALQTFLVAEPPSSLPTPPRLLSPISLAPPKRTTSHRAKVMKPQRPAMPQRGLNKRRRAMEDDGSEHEFMKRAKPSTPKQQRMCPPSLPLGLAQADFDALQPSSPSRASPTTNPPPQSQPQPFTFRMPPDHSCTSPQPLPQPTPENQTPWSPPLSDETLITLLLSKLRLRREDWDDCARRLGTGKDSIGARWRLLVGEGAGAGLRRGGRRVRGRVDAERWL